MKKTNSISLIKKYGLALCLLFTTAKSDLVSIDDYSDSLYIKPSSEKVSVNVPLLGDKTTHAFYNCVYRRDHLVGAVNPFLITFGLGSHDYVSSDLTGGYLNPATVIYGASKLYGEFQKGSARTDFPSSKSREAQYLFYGYAAYKALNTYQQLESQEEATLTKIFLSALSGFPGLNVGAEFIVRFNRAVYLSLPTKGVLSKSLPVSPKLMDRFESNLGAISTPDISCP